MSEIKGSPAGMTGCSTGCMVGGGGGGSVNRRVVLCCVVLCVGPGAALTVSD